MIDRIISWSLHNRPLVLGLSVLLLAAGGWVAWRMPVDVFPDLTAPTVTILTEGQGMAPDGDGDARHVSHRNRDQRRGGRATGPLGYGRRHLGGLGRVRVGPGHLPRPADGQRDASRQSRPTCRPRWSRRPSRRSRPSWARSSSSRCARTGTTRSSCGRLPKPGPPAAARGPRRVAGRRHRRRRAAVSGRRLAGRLAAADVSIDEVEEALRRASRNTSAGFLVAGGQEYLIQGIGQVRTNADIEQTVVAARGTQPDPRRATSATSASARPSSGARARTTASPPSSSASRSSRR